MEKTHYETLVQSVSGAQIDLLEGKVEVHASDYPDYCLPLTVKYLRITEEVVSVFSINKK